MENTAGQSDNGNAVLSRRMSKQHTTDRIHDLNDSYMRRISLNSYSEKNECGIINLGTAFSYVCEDVMEKQLNGENPDVAASVLEREDRQIWHPPTFHGNISFRRDLADFFSAKFNAKIDTENLVVVNGTTSALDCIAHCIADAEDVILIPTPGYAYLYRNINLRAEVDYFPVDLAEGDGEKCRFILTAEKVERAIVDATNKGKNVRGLILVNPSNPLGEVYGEKLVAEILEVCCRHKVHVILDEIHSMTVFNETVPFRSAVAFEHIPDPDRTHIVWSFSKDFCAPGLRISIIHSASSQVIQSLRALGCFFMVPNLEQRVCSQIIRDTEFLEKTFFPVHLQRLRESHLYASQRLIEMGVGVLPATCGFVLMADFSKFLTEQNREGERDLVERFLSEGVYITPGHILCCSAPGWFRVVVSYPRQITQLAFDRIEKALQQDRRATSK